MRHRALELGYPDSVALTRLLYLVAPNADLSHVDLRYLFRVLRISHLRVGFITKKPNNLRVETRRAKPKLL